VVTEKEMCVRGLFHPFLVGWRDHQIVSCEKMRKVIPTSHTNLYRISYLYVFLLA